MKQRSSSRHSTTSHQSGGSGKSGGSRGPSNLRYSYRADRNANKSSSSGVRLSESQKRKSGHESRLDQALTSSATTTTTATAVTTLPNNFGRIPKVNPSCKRTNEAKESRQEPDSKRSHPEPIL